MMQSLTSSQRTPNTETHLDPSTVRRQRVGGATHLPVTDGLEGTDGAYYEGHGSDGSAKSDNFHDPYHAVTVVVVVCKRGRNNTPA